MYIPITMVYSTVINVAQTVKYHNTTCTRHFYKFCRCEMANKCGSTDISRIQFNACIHVCTCIYMCALFTTIPHPPTQTSPPPHTHTHLEFNVTPFAGPAWAFDLEDRLSISILHCKPRVHKAEVLPDVAHYSARRTLDFNMLQTAEAAPGLAAVWTLNVYHLQQNH